MPKHHKRTRSRDGQRRQEKNTGNFGEIQKQLDNLTKVMLVQVQREQEPSSQSQVSEIVANGTNEKDSNMDIESIQQKQSSESTALETNSLENVLKALGIDLNESKFKNITYHPELMNSWSKWFKQGLPEKNKKEIPESYNRKGDVYVEAPKVNLEIIPLLSDVAKKKDQHFLDTQNCIGRALAALGAAVSTFVERPTEGIDEDAFADYFSHAGQILTNVFYQQSVARKSFITPELNKSIKPTVDAAISNEWLYGNNLKEKVKDAKEIEKACAEIKEKTQATTYSKSRIQGNSKYRPAHFRRVGYQQKPRQSHFKQRTSHGSTQNPSKTAYSTSHSALSAAHKRGVDIATIRRSAGWAPLSRVFFKFYKKPIQAPNDQFARAVLC